MKQCSQCQRFAEKGSMIKDWGLCTNKCPQGLGVFKHKASMICDDFKTLMPKKGK